MKSRDGDFVSRGSVPGCASEKLYRVCRSSLAADVLSLSDGCDIAMWNKTLLVDVIIGRFLREIPEPSQGYMMQTPFGLVPSVVEVQNEMMKLPGKAQSAGYVGKEVADESKDAPIVKNDLADPGTTAEMMRIRSNLTHFENKYVEMLKLMLFTDSTNAYASILSGHPATSERTLRIQLSYVGIYQLYAVLPS